MPFTESGTDTDEESKRKRQQTDDFFGRSKLTKRTPSKGSKENGNEDNTEGVMITMMKELLSKNEEMMGEIKQLRKEQRENQQQLVEIKQENKKMKQEIKTLSEKIDSMERENKRKNVVISGLEINTKDDKVLKERMEKFITEELKVEVKIRNARKIGEKMCVIETESFKEKMDILSNKSKLRSLPERIFIDSELTKKEQEIQKRIRNIAKQERDKGNQTKIGYKKLIVNGKQWRWDDDKDQLREDPGGNQSKN